MSRNTLIVDVVIAAVVTILIVVLAPGLAVVGLLALLIVLICAISFGIDAWRRRRVRRRADSRIRRSPPRNGKKVAAPRR